MFFKMAHELRVVPIAGRGDQDALYPPLDAGAQEVHHRLVEAVGVLALCLASGLDGLAEDVPEGGPPPLQADEYCGRISPPASAPGHGQRVGGHD